MNYIFWNCSSLEKLNLSNFNTNKVTNMGGLFCECSSLKELILTNFKIGFVYSMDGMFHGCSDELKMKIKSENKNIKDEAFW